MKKRIVTGLFTALAVMANAQFFYRMAESGSECCEPCPDAHQLFCLRIGRRGTDGS